MILSSTSSSRTLEAFPVPTRAAWLTLSVLILVRLYFVFDPQPIFPLARDATEMYAQLPEVLYERFTTRDEGTGPPRPRLLFLGSSRQFMMPPNRVRRVMHLEPGDVRSFAYPSSKYFPMYQLIKQHPSLTERCEVVIIDVLPAQLSRQPDKSELNGVFLQQATLTQRLRIEKPSERLVACADMVWPYYSLCYSVREWMHGTMKSFKELDVQNAELLNEEVRRVTERAERNSAEANMSRVIEAEFPPLDHLEVQRRALLDLIDAFPDTTQILIVRPPYRDDANRIILEREDCYESMMALKDFVDSIDRPNVEVIWVERASDLGMTDEDFSGDGAHYSRSGMIKLINFHAKTVSDRNLLRVP